VYTGMTISPAVVSVEVGETTTLQAFGTLPGGTSVALSSGVSWTSADASISTIHPSSGAVRGVAAGTTVITATFGSYSASASITVRAVPPLPPDPAAVASPLRESELTSFADATSFLYTGPAPIQTGVAPGIIEPLRASVIRGIVRTREGAPIGGVTVRIAAHPEYGTTLTRADGSFDLALNGGNTVIVSFDKNGYLTAHRTFFARWQDFGTVEDVVMIRFDPVATTVASNASQLQVARGSVARDEDGERRATLLVPARTGASMTLPDGTTRPLSKLTIRITEYTVGLSGSAAMPAPLPPLTGYTYCVELSADEAVQEGANTVTFSRPLAFYVENFLGFPVGSDVPSGYYDRQRRAWIPSSNGRILAIIGITASKADLDISGDGIADNDASLAVLGIDSAERETLAALYSAGTSLWRVPVEHFTPYDLNWPVASAAPNAIAPPDPPEWAEHPDDPNQCSGSIIRCETQTLGERIPIQGTPFDLVYESGRVRGRATNRSFTLRATGPRAPPVRFVKCRCASKSEDESSSVRSGEARIRPWNSSGMAMTATAGS
jgi:hypothetical protein